MSERQIKEEKNAILTRERLRIICCSPEQINAKKKKKELLRPRLFTRLLCFLFLFVWRRSFAGHFAVFLEQIVSWRQRTGPQTDSCSVAPLGGLGRLETWAKICESWCAGCQSEESWRRGAADICVTLYYGWCASGGNKRSCPIVCLLKCDLHTV